MGRFAGARRTVPVNSVFGDTVHGGASRDVDGDVVVGVTTTRRCYGDVGSLVTTRTMKRLGADNEGCRNGATTRKVWW